MIYDAMIIGGGASGLAAACALSRGGRRIVVLERQGRVGRKLLSTGNGRCNLTNLNARAQDYHGARQAAQTALRAWPPSRIVRFFKSIGLPCTADGAGRVYPMSGQAASVLDALRLYASENGAEIVTDFPVESLVRDRQGFTAGTADGRRARARLAMVCTGGLAAPKLGARGDGYRLLEGLGHRVSETFPAISALITPPEPVRGLKGIRAAGQIELLAAGEPVRAERGEILFAESGISGIAAMQMARAWGEARRAGRACTARLNFMPDATDVPTQIAERAALLPARPLEDFLNGIVPRRLGQRLASAAGVTGMARRADSLKPGEIAAIARTLTGWVIPVTGVQGFDQAQVTAGGADLRDFDARQMRSLRTPGLFAAGEVLDVDGDCGGFNLQWAFSSALMAAEGMEQMLKAGVDA